jgi:hypothetical protein
MIDRRHTEDEASMRLLVTGGFFDDSGECWVERVSPNGDRLRVLTFSPPAPCLVKSKGFTGACALGDDILICSFNAVWRFNPRWELVGRLHQPDFNDLHGVAFDPGAQHVIVVNTGLDSVEVFDLDGRLRGRHSMTPAWFEHARQGLRSVPRAAFPPLLSAGWATQARADQQIPWESPRGTYYQNGQPAEVCATVESPAFHSAFVRDYMHPNHALSLPDGRLLVTLLAPREVRCLRTHTTFAELEGHPHDGVIVDGDLWCTTTDGRVWAINLNSGEQKLMCDTSRTGHIGWCRGLAVGRDWFAVGLTAMQAGAQYDWRSDPIDRTETSILWFSRRDGTFIGRVDLSSPRAAKVFSLLSGGPG